MTLGRLDGEGNIRQPTEFRFHLRDHSDGAFLELAAMMRKQKGEIAAQLCEASPPLELPPAPLGLEEIG